MNAHSQEIVKEREYAQKTYFVQPFNVSELTALTDFLFYFYFLIYLSNLQYKFKYRQKSIRKYRKKKRKHEINVKDIKDKSQNLSI